MSFFLQYPEQIQRYVIQDWLEVSDISRLVVASTNKSTRKQWLHCIHSGFSPSYLVGQTFLHLSSPKNCVGYRLLEKGCNDEEEILENNFYDEIQQIITTRNWNDHFSFAEHSVMDGFHHYFFDYCYEDLYSVNLKLLTLLDRLFLLNDEEQVYHNDIKPSNIIIEEENKVLLQKWEFSFKVGELINLEHFPEDVTDRNFLFNRPFTSLLFTEQFFEDYTNYLRTGGQINETSLRPFVVNFLNSFFRSYGKGDYDIVVTIMDAVFGFLDPEFNGSNRRQLIESNFMQPMLIDQMIDALIYFTRFDEDGELDLRAYFREIFLPNLDIWGFLSIYFPLIYQLSLYYFLLNNLELKLYKQLQYIFVTYLFTEHNQPIDRTELLEDLNIVSKILFRLSNSSHIPTTITKRDKNDTPKFVQVHSITSLFHGSLLASAGSDSVINLWNVPENDLILTLTGHTNTVTSVLEVKNGLLATGSYDLSIKIWDISSLQQENKTVLINERKASQDSYCVSTLIGHTAAVLTLKLLSDQRLASASVDHSIKIWNLLSGECDITLSDHTESVLCITEMPSFSFEVDDDSDDDTIRIMSGMNVTESNLKIWNLSNEQCEVELTVSSGIHTILPLESIRKYAFACQDGNIQIWRFEMNKSSRFHSNCDMILSGHLWHVTSMIELKHRYRLISSSVDQSIRIWNLLTGRCERVLSGHQSHISCLTLLPPLLVEPEGGFGTDAVKDLQYEDFSSGSFDGTIYLWYPAIE